MPKFLLDPPRMSPRIAEKMKVTAYLIEATDFEKMALWKEYNPDPRYMFPSDDDTIRLGVHHKDVSKYRFKSWQQDGEAWGSQIGKWHGVPVMLMFSWAVLEGVRVAFWQASGMAIHRGMMDEWLDTYFFGITRVTVDNFHEIFRYIKTPENAPHTQPRKEKPVAVKVISDKPVRTKKKVCPHCGYRLEYTDNDVSTRNGTDYGGGPDGCDYIICPRDGKEVILRSW